MTNAEEAFPKDKERRFVDDAYTVHHPRAPYPEWMRDRSLLPKRPPTKRGE